MLKIICASITGILFVSNVYAASSIEKKLGTFATVIKQAEVAKSVLFDGDSQQLLKKGEDLTGDALVQMQTLLLQDENYWADEPKKKCRFSPEVVLQFEKGEVQFSFSCNILSFKSRSLKKAVTKNFDPIAPQLDGLLKPLFVKVTPTFETAPVVAPSESVPAAAPAPVIAPSVIVHPHKNEDVLEMQKDSHWGGS